MKTAPVAASVSFSASRLLVLICAAFGALAGCATTESQHPAQEQRTAAPAPAPIAANAPVANFGPALRCMDTLLADYGVRDVTVMVEDLTDGSKGSAGNAKEMLTAVVAGMTQRSRAIRVIASGKDWGNTASALAASKRDPLATLPQYALRGTLTLQDGLTTRRGNDTYASSQLGVDLSLVNTQDFSVVPGVASRNAATLYRQGRTFDGRGDLQKFGVTFALATPATAMPAEATRTLVELGSIELFGRLARVPYWTCLGMTEAHAGVSAELEDWFDGISVSSTELIKYFQAQLRLRRVYDGPIDGASNPSFKEAVLRYREALGLPREAKLTLEFFRAYLAADHVQLAAVLTPPAAAPVQVAAAAPAAPTGLPPAPTSIAPKPVATLPAAPTQIAAASALSLRIATGADVRFAPGQAVELTIQPSRTAHVYCYLQDTNGQIQRFFPNQWRGDSRVLPAEGVKLPGKMRFKIAADGRDTVACFATDRDVWALLPDALRTGDFDAMPVASLDDVKGAFARAGGASMAHATIQLPAARK